MPPATSASPNTNKPPSESEMALFNILRSRSTFLKFLLLVLCTTGAFLLFSTTVVPTTPTVVSTTTSDTPDLAPVADWWLQNRHHQVPRNLTELSRKKIPRIIHQSWKTNHLPKRFLAWSQTWKSLNPTYTYRLWTDEDNRALVVNFFPWFLSTYDGLPHNINRADAVRYMYLYQFGGIYADLDVEALKPMDDLITVSRAAINRPSKKPSADITDEPRNMVHVERVLLGEDDSIPDDDPSSTLGPKEPELLLPLMGADYTFEHNIPNAWMASRPGHALWIHCLMMIQEKYIKWRRGVAEDETVVETGVEGMTGPVLLFEALKRYENTPLSEEDVAYSLEPGVIFPFNWNQASPEVFNICSAAFPTLDEEACKKHHNATGKKHQKAWSITYWSHSWEGIKNMVIEG